MNKLELISEVLVDEITGFNKDVQLLIQTTDTLKSLNIKPDLSELRMITKDNLHDQRECYNKFNEVTKQSIIELTEIKTADTLLFKVLIIFFLSLSMILGGYSIYQHLSIKSLDENLNEVTKEKNTFKSFILESEQRKEKYLEWYNTDDK